MEASASAHGHGHGRGHRRGLGGDRPHRLREQHDEGPLEADGDERQHVALAVAVAEARYVAGVTRLGAQPLGAPPQQHGRVRLRVGEAQQAKHAGHDQHQPVVPAPAQILIDEAAHDRACRCVSQSHMHADHQGGRIPSTGPFMGAAGIVSQPQFAHHTQFPRPT